MSATEKAFKIVLEKDGQIITLENVHWNHRFDIESAFSENGWKVTSILEPSSSRQL